METWPPCDRILASQSAEGPRDKWRGMRKKYRVYQGVRRAGCTAGVYGLVPPGSRVAGRWRWRVAGGDGSGATNNPQVAVAESGRLADLGKITRYPDGDAPPDLRVCPPRLTAKLGKVCMVRDWSDPEYAIYGMLRNPNVDQGVMGTLLSFLQVGAQMAGIDLPECFLDCLVSPVAARLLGNGHPVTGRLGVYLSLPSGSGPSPGWDDRCGKEILRVTKTVRPPLVAVDFVDDLRLVAKSGDRTQLFVALARFMEMLS